MPKPTMLPGPNTCTMFRDTLACDATGTKLNPVRTSDKACNVMVPTGMSGFCECGWYEHNGEYLRKKTHMVGCSSAQFKCSDMCSSNSTPSVVPHTANAKATCAGWKQTGGCSPHGANEHAHDKACNVQIPQGDSGYCECQHMVKIPPATHQTLQSFKMGEVGCGHTSFNCSDVCAGVKPLPTMLPTEKKCVSWRETKLCDGTANPAQREPINDQSCATNIASGKSGYCECGWKPSAIPGVWEQVKTSLTGCTSRSPINCAASCAAGAGTKAPTAAGGTKGPTAAGVTKSPTAAGVTKAPTAATAHGATPGCSDFQTCSASPCTGVGSVDRYTGGVGVLQCTQIIPAGKAGECQCKATPTSPIVAKGTVAAGHEPFNCTGVCMSGIAAPMLPVSPGCTAWRETTGCDATGTKRLAGSDHPCSKKITAGESGFCECGYKKVGTLYPSATYTLDKRGQDLHTHAPNNLGFGCDAPHYLRNDFTCTEVCEGALPTFKTHSPTISGATKFPTPAYNVPTAHTTAGPTMTPDASLPRVEAVVLLKTVTAAAFADGGPVRKHFVEILAGHMSVKPGNVVLMRETPVARRRRRQLLVLGSTEVAFAVLGNSFTTAEHVRAILALFLTDDTTHGFGYQLKVSVFLFHPVAPHRTAPPLTLSRSI